MGAGIHSALIELNLKAENTVTVPKCENEKCKKPLSNNLMVIIKGKWRYSTDMDRFIGGIWPLVWTYDIKPMDNPEFLTRAFVALECRGCGQRLSDQQQAEWFAWRKLRNTYRKLTST